MAVRMFPTVTPKRPTLSSVVGQPTFPETNPCRLNNTHRNYSDVSVSSRLVHHCPTTVFTYDQFLSPLNNFLRCPIMYLSVSNALFICFRLVITLLSYLRSPLHHLCLPFLRSCSVIFFSFNDGTRPSVSRSRNPSS
jgi:hypothetical protein